MKRDQNMVLLQICKDKAAVDTLVDVSFLSHHHPGRISWELQFIKKTTFYYKIYFLATGKCNGSVCEIDQFVFAL